MNAFLRFLAAFATLTTAIHLNAHDLVLANGRVMDPASGLDAVRHIGITGGKISAISETPLSGDKVLDVAGHVVSPGFIDIHAHGQTTGDMQIQARDGVTTALDMEVGVYPVNEWYRSMEGKTPLNFGAAVGHITVRFAAFHPQLRIGHWAVIALVFPASAHRPQVPTRSRARLN